MKRLMVFPAMVSGFLLMVVLLYLAVISFAFNPGEYPKTSPYDEMAVELTEYMAGPRAALSDTLFTERERLHMEDVRDLFHGGQQLAIACLWISVVLTTLAFIFGGRRRVGNGWIIGISLFLLFLCAIGIWAAVDFNGWFTRMHELVFTNDLWQLDPAESALIRMLPLGFFIDAVKTIIFRFVLASFALLFVAGLLRKRRRTKEAAWTTKRAPTGV